MKNLIDLIDNKTTKSVSTKLPEILFKAQVDSHITHLLQKDRKFPTHNAMSIFYDEIDDLLDTFTETYMGIYGLESITVPVCENIDNPLNYFQDLYNKIENERKGISESFLLSQIDVIQELVAHTIYRLKYIKD